MPFEIQHGKISTVAPFALKAGQASYKRFLEQQNAETARQAASMAFQSREREADRQYQGERDARTEKMRSREAEEGFSRQKELIGIQAEVRNEQRAADTIADMSKFKAMQDYNQERQKSMDQYTYDLSQKRKLDSLDRAETIIDELVASERRSEDEQTIQEARMQIEADRAGVHRSALPKPKPDPEAEVAQNVVQIDQGDGTKQVWYRKGEWAPAQDKSANRLAVFAKVQGEVLKTLVGRKDEEGKDIPVSKEEYNSLLEMTMEAQERFLGKQQAQAQEPPPVETPESASDAAKFAKKHLDAKKIKQRIQSLPPVQRQQLEEERDRIMERMKWAKNSGAHIEYARAKEELTALIQSAVNPQPGVAPPMETAGVQ